MLTQVNEDDTFMRFIMKNNLANKYNVSQIFVYDYRLDRPNFSKIDRNDMGKDSFYIDGSDLWKAFQAGINAQKRSEEVEL